MNDNKFSGFNNPNDLLNFMEIVKNLKKNLDSSNNAKAEEKIEKRVNEIEKEDNNQKRIDEVVDVTVKGLFLFIATCITCIVDDFFKGFGSASSESSPPPFG